MCPMVAVSSGTTHACLMVQGHMGGITLARYLLLIVACDSWLRHSKKGTQEEWALGPGRPPLAQPAPPGLQWRRLTLLPRPLLATAGWHGSGVFPKASALQARVLGGPPCPALPDLGWPWLRCLALPSKCPFQSLLTSGLNTAPRGRQRSGCDCGVRPLFSFLRPSRGRPGAMGKESFQSHNPAHPLACRPRPEGPAQWMSPSRIFHGKHQTAELQTTPSLLLWLSWGTCHLPSRLAGQCGHGLVESGSTRVCPGRTS